MVEVHSNGEVIYAIVVCVIAIINMMQGFIQFKDSFQAIGASEAGEIGNAEESRDEEAAGKYDFVGKDEDSSRAETNNEVVLETDENSDLDKQPQSDGAESKWKSSDNDIVKLDGDNDDNGNDPNKA